MNKQKGSTTVVLISFLALALVMCIGLVSFYVSSHNIAVRYEANIEKFHKESQNSLSSYTLKLKEAAKVPDKYVSDLRSVIEATFNGRYGENGSQATFQWLQERNIPLDSSVYVKLQTIIDAGRSEFKQSQDRKLEACADYEIVRNNFFKGMFISFAGFPKKDLDTLCRIIIDQTTSDKFQTGVDSEVIF